MSIRQDVFEKLAFRAAQLFGKEQAALTEATRFVEDCNAKSVQYSQITTFLEDEFDIEIPYMEFRRQATFGDAVRFVVEECLGETFDDEESAPAETPAAAPAASEGENERQKEVLAKLAERASGLFGVPAESITREKRFVEDFNAKSVQYSQITTFLEDEFDIEIPYMEFRRQATVGEAVDYVKRSARRQRKRHPQSRRLQLQKLLQKAVPQNPITTTNWL